MKFVWVWVPLLVAAASVPGFGDTGALPFLNPLFADHMVLQRGMPDPVWGWSTPGSVVTVSIDGVSAKARTDSSGEWVAKLPSLSAGGPYTLTVTGLQTVTLQDIMVGDVWICAGQSNMEFGIGNALNADAETAAANYPNIRLFTVPRATAITPLATAAGQWQVCTPASVRQEGTWNGFSAVGYYFGRDIFQTINVPIGLIQSTWGGTAAEAWTSQKTLPARLPEFKPAFGILAAARTAAAQNKQLSPADLVSQWYAQSDPGTAGNWQAPNFDDSSWKSMQLPNYFEQVDDPTLVPFHGIIWFRREVDLPDAMAGKDAILHLYADDNDATWVNGTPVGYTEGYSTERKYAVAGSLLRPGRNFIAVRVLDTGGLGGIYGKPEQLSLEFPGGQPLGLDGAWRYKPSAPLSSLEVFPSDVHNQNFPSVLYNGMIAPIQTFGIRGAIWYQGENNASRAYQYRALLPAMIGDWRQHWGEGPCPFYIVQLANFRPPSEQPGDDEWAELREAQLMTAEHTPNSGIALAVDIGDANNIHPKNKQEVGRRLSLVALAKTYGQAIEYSGPVYRAYKVEAGAIRIAFTHLGGGLVAKDGAALTGFAVAGADHKFVWGDAKIDGDTVVVSSAQVPSPVAVRYAWSINPAVSLYNQAGLPAPPFRTDDWPGITYNNK